MSKTIKDRIWSWVETLQDTGIGISTEGRRRVLIAGCEELLTYEAECVRIRTARGVIGVFGKHLTLRAYHGDRMLVEGEWANLGWETEEGDEKDEL